MSAATHGEPKPPLMTAAEAHRLWRLLAYRMAAPPRVDVGGADGGAPVLPGSEPSEREAAGAAGVAGAGDGAAAGGAAAGGAAAGGAAAGGAAK